MEDTKVMAEKIVSSLNENPEAGTPPSEGQPNTSGSAQAGSQQAPATPVTQEELDYLKDERTKRMWTDPKTKTFNPNLMYKSYRSADELIEKQYKPLKAQAETFTKFLSEYGFEPNPEKLKPIFDEYKSFKDPENPTIKRANFFSYFYDNPKYKGEVEALFENMRRRELQEKFPGMTDEQVKEILELKQFKSDMEMRMKKEEEEKVHQETLTTINQGWDKVKDKAAKLGFPVSDEIRVKLLEQCAKDNVPPNLVYAKFMEMYEEEIFKHQRAMTQAEQIKKLEKNRKSGVIPASSSVAQSKPAGTGQKPGLLDRVMGRIKENQS